MGLALPVRSRRHPGGRSPRRPIARPRGRDCYGCYRQYIDRLDDGVKKGVKFIYAPDPSPCLN